MTTPVIHSEMSYSIINVPLWLGVTASGTKVAWRLLTLAPIMCPAHSWPPISQSFNLELYVFTSQLFVIARLTETSSLGPII